MKIERLYEPPTKPGWYLRQLETPSETLPARMVRAMLTEDSNLVFLVDGNYPTVVGGDSYSAERWWHIEGVQP